MATAENEECAMAKEADTLLLNANQGVDFGLSPDNEHIEG